MPPRVARNTIQSAMFMRKSRRTPRAGPQRGQSIRTRTGIRRATYGIQASRAARRRIAGQAAMDRSFTQGEEVRKQPIRSGHSFRKLPKPRKAGVHEIPLAIPPYEQAPSEGYLAWIAEGEDRREAFIPFIREIQTTLLNPSVEICCSDAIRMDPHRVIGCQERYRCLLVRDSVS